MGYLQSELTVVLCLRVSVLVRPTRISPRQSGRDREAVHSIPLRGVHTVSALCSAARRPGVESLVLQAPGAYHYRISRGPAGPSIAELYSMVQVVLVREKRLSRQDRDKD